MINRLQAVRRRISKMLTSPGEELGRGMRLVRFQVRLWYFCARRLAENNAMAMSAALSFRTIFALVPSIVLMVVAMKSFGGLDQAKTALRRLLNESGFSEIRVVEHTPATSPATATATSPATAPATGPATAPATGPAGASSRRAAKVINVADEIEKLVERVERKISFGRLGPIGVALLIWTALTLMTTVERSLNRIFRAPRPRALGRRILLYWSTMTLGPVAYFVADWAGRQLISLFERVGGLGWLLVAFGWVQPIAVGILLLTGIYVLAPNTKVALKAALAAAAVTFPLWLLAKWAFGLYVTRVVADSPLYGSLGLIPLFLMWLNTSWLLFLFGAEIAHTASSLGQSVFAKRSEETSAGTWEMLAAALAVAKHYAGGLGPAGSDDVARRLGVPADLAQTLLEKLARLGCLCAVEGAERSAYVPARSLDTIPVADVLALGSRDDDRPEELGFVGEMLPLVGRVRGTARAALEGVTLADVLRWADEGPTTDDPARGPAGSPEGT
ncbi:MAG: YihY family inner membrane protein [Planctomycetes bacterium]|nr:YihY family inner membrane protein [Planctomycetota bacterium]